jgi:hypothetical protein
MLLKLFRCGVLLASYPFLGMALLMIGYAAKDDEIDRLLGEKMSKYVVFRNRDAA